MTADSLGGDVTLVGTVHVSPDSRSKVISTIRDVEPDVVAIELDPARYYHMRNNPDAESGPTDLLQTVLTGDLKPKGAIAQFVLSRLQSSMAGDLDVQIGESDFLPAVDVAHELEVPAAFIDDDARRTVNEIGDAFTIRNILGGLLNAGFFELASSYTTIRDIASEHGLHRTQTAQKAVSILEEMPYEDIERVMSAYEVLAPDGVFDHFLHDRNEQMAGRIKWLQQNVGDVTAVMGRAHVPGVERLLEQPERIPVEYIRRPEFAPVPITADE